MNILDKIVEKTRERVSSLDKKFLEKEAGTLNKKDFSFKKALFGNNIKIIAEIKKASPSKGLICKSFDPYEIALEYKKADVDCISVLTEPDFFMGDNSYLKMAKRASDKPILRKDFIIDEAQIFESRLIGADCILLICSILEKSKLKSFIEIAHENSMSCLIEAHDEKEIEMALDVGACIIGVNNRNLKTFEIDFNNTFKLRKLVPSNKIFVSESGIKTREDIIKLENIGVNAVLIGETFMRAKNKDDVIKNLRGI